MYVVGTFLSIRLFEYIMTLYSNIYINCNVSYWFEWLIYIVLTTVPDPISQFIDLINLIIYIYVIILFQLWYKRDSDSVLITQYPVRQCMNTWTHTYGHVIENYKYVIEGILNTEIINTSVLSLCVHNIVLYSTKLLLNYSTVQ